MGVGFGVGVGFWFWYGVEVRVRVGVEVGVGVGVRVRVGVRAAVGASALWDAARGGRGVGEVLETSGRSVGMVWGRRGMRLLRDCDVIVM